MAESPKRGEENEKMKIKILNIIIAVFFVGIALMGTYVLADDQGQGDDLPDSVIGDLQQPQAQNPKSTGSPKVSETDKTPGGDVKKPASVGEDGKPVKYTDKDGDHYWGTDGHLYPWPPPKVMGPLTAVNAELSILHNEVFELANQVVDTEDDLADLSSAVLSAMEAGDTVWQAEIMDEILYQKNKLSENKKKFKEKHKEIDAKNAEKSKIKKKIANEKNKKLNKLKKRTKTKKATKRIKIKKSAHGAKPCP